ncbi:MAG: hypothetical protein QXN68_02710 [Thermoplasmata archaeon]
MVVETRNGNRYLVFVDKIIRDNGWLRLSNYSDDLNDKDNEKEFDIVKVFDIVNRLDDVKTTTKLLWERKEKLPYETPKLNLIDLEDIEKIAIFVYALAFAINKLTKGDKDE